MIKYLMKKYGVLKTTVILSILCIIVSELIAAVSWHLAGLPNLGFLLIVAFLCPAIIAPPVIVSLCRLNEGLSRNEEFLNLVFDAIQDGVSVLDRNLNIIRVNKTMRELYSHMLPFEGEKKCYEVYHGRSEHCDICPTLRALKSGKLETDIVPLVSEEGVTGTIELFAFPIIEESGSIDGVVEYVRNITDHVETLKALADSEKKYKTLFDSASDAIFIHDMKGKILDVNNIAYARLGYTKKELLGMSLSQLDHPDFATKIPERIQKIQESGKILFESAHIRKDGSIMPVEVNATIIFLGDDKVIFSVVRDISLRKKLEEEVLKVKKLETTGVLAGGIAHDFNNILTAILGNINMALTDTKLSKETKKRLLDSENASLRATGLTQQLLTFSKGGEPIKETASLFDIVKDSADFVLRGHNVDCHYLFPENLWLVDIDKGQISQVIQNLVINASHAMPEGGTINITAENVTLEDNSQLPKLMEGKYIKLRIQDSGIGMPENVLKNIFDPYFSTKDKGSGLGLAISLSIINKHQGDIIAESTPGVGTTFTIYLPATDKTEPEKQEIAETNKSIPKARILIMDDDEMVRNILEDMLTTLGHEVFFASNGKEAISAYNKSINSDNSFDLVIMDLTIPGGMGGKEAVQGILKLDKEAKVIVSSGYNNDPIMANYEDYGFCAAIAKPYSIHKLSKIISQFIN